MTVTVDAIYEGGLLRPVHPLPLSDRAQVRVTVEQIAGCQDAAEATLPAEPATQPTLGEWLASLARDLPPEAFAGLPTDGASQHDHYIYGTPKRTDLRDQPE